jgi:hypothetical protein
VLEGSFAIAANEVNLMLATFPVHHLYVIDRVSGRQFRNEFRDEVRLGSRPVEPFVGNEDDLLQKRPLGFEQEVQHAAVRPAKGPDHRWLGRFGPRLRQFSHGNLLNSDIVKEYGAAQSRILSFIKPGDRAGLTSIKIALLRPQ